MRSISRHCTKFFFCLFEGMKEKSAIWAYSRDSLLGCLWHESTVPSLRHATTAQIWIIPAQWLQNINNVENGNRERKWRGEHEWYAQQDAFLLLLPPPPISLLLASSSSLRVLLFHLQTPATGRRRRKINSSKFPADKIMKIEKESDR